MTYKVEKTEQEWRDELGSSYSILREAATERPWSGALLDEKREGTYLCGACKSPLFKSGAKFDSGSGWPSFFESVNPDAVELRTDKTLGMTRTEVVCATCGSHLGHLFDDAYQTPTGDRYCMNSLSLDFEPEPRSRRSNTERTRRRSPAAVPVIRDRGRADPRAAAAARRGGVGCRRPQLVAAVAADRAARGCATAAGRRVRRGVGAR